MNEELLKQLLDELQAIKKQVNDIETKIDNLAHNQAVIEGMLNGTIDISHPVYRGMEKMN
ncbi:MAG TPA: hypothetical protein PKA28_11480 [Methylomusa anaerophila]|uniref:Uncharacterized protein n=1 Tax=Methylomusa anaerophila TaxID=1930071 RepID=A0A348AJD0_9FIRM|nr:hypothetical protein [Methylomusa anaerophila]BBB91178.1 hypothetical protein MAMMFC1_01849 [Methylomusa anaerophila]HML89055.1 hypothetical protein [Methylomusa anaerophila]